MNVRISSDSTCDLSRDLIEINQIQIIPLYVVMDGVSYRDGIEIEPQQIFDHVEKSGRPASTAAVNVEDYRLFFARQLEDYDGIVHFTVSSEMSSCYQNACLAASEFDNVHVVDSRNLSTGIGHLVIDAAEMARKGMTAAEIADAVNEKKQKLDVSFVINTLEYLHMGGRCSTVAALGANILGLKPCIEVRNGSMGVGKKYRGQLEKCLIKYVTDRLSDVDSIDDSRVFITDSGISDEIYEKVRQQVIKCLPFREVIHTRAGCTISNHCGPNCLGILFYRK